MDGFVVSSISPVNAEPAFYKMKINIFCITSNKECLKLLRILAVGKKFGNMLLAMLLLVT
ncbi:hypothetical protein B14911_12322 [Bacillus sp. NRRL B-14911]|nr:hypothetical protein B14911_12322 [Bacillus sp. NRRL B-14911]